MISQFIKFLLIISSYTKNLLVEDIRNNFAFLQEHNEVQRWKVNLYKRIVKYCFTPYHIISDHVTEYVKFHV